MFALNVIFTIFNILRDKSFYLSRKCYILWWYMLKNGLFTCICTNVNFILIIAPLNQNNRKYQYHTMFMIWVYEYCEIYTMFEFNKFEIIL